MSVDSEVSKEVENELSSGREAAIVTLGQQAQVPREEGRFVELLIIRAQKVIRNRLSHVGVSEL